MVHLPPEASFLRHRLLSTFLGQERELPSTTTHEMTSSSHLLIRAHLSHQKQRDGLYMRPGERPTPLTVKLSDSNQKRYFRSRFTACRPLA